MSEKSEEEKLVFVRVGFLIITNLIISITLYFSYQYDNIFAIFIYGIFGLISLIQLIKIILVKNKSALIISLISTLSIFYILCHFEYKLNKETFIKANQHGVYLDLKKDGTYIIKSGSWTSKKHYYGDFIYSAKDSIITLDKNINDGTLKSKRLKIKKIKNFLKIDNKYHNFLIQVDLNNNEIKNSKDSYWEFYRFEINNEEN